MRGYSVLGVSWVVTSLLGCASTSDPSPPPPAASCLARPSAMLHFWPGDGNGRDVVVGADASVLSGASFANGFVASGGGQAFLFDGLDASAQVPDRPSLNPTDSFTLMAWARVDSEVGNSGTVVGKGRHQDEGFVIDHTSGVWRGFLRNAAGQAIQIRSGPFTLGVWAHLALTWDGQLVSFYRDGSLVGALASSTLRPSDSFLGIGFRSEEGFTDAELDFEFSGAVDEVGFFGRALNANEISDIFEAGAEGICKT